MYELEAVFNYYNIPYDSMQGKIICPFHGDIRPSMVYNIYENKFFCFGCYLSGDAMKFTMLMENKLHGSDELDGCIKYFKIIKGISKKSADIKSIHYNHHNGLQSELYMEAYNYYNGLSKVNWIKSDASEKYYMLNRGFSAEVLNKVKAKINISNNYPIIFPILDNNKFRGWVCRTDKKEVEQVRKYLYNKGFRRANTLVGNYDSNHIPIICEGFMDRLKFIQFGYDYAISIFGWKISDEQINKLKSLGITKVVSALDNDECGIKGTDYLSKYFLVTRVKYPKKVKDPGDMSKNQIVKMLNQIGYSK